MKSKYDALDERCSSLVEQLSETRSSAAQKEDELTQALASKVCKTVVT